jgi:hypothetical protein
VPTRPNATASVLDLARRLAEEFDSVPLPLVSRAVKTAADAARLFGEDVAAALPTIERIAREDLMALRAVSAETAASA